MDDILAGQKEILAYLRRSDWRSVLRLVRDEALPVAKIAGRWESSKMALDAWHSSRLVRDVPQTHTFTQ